MLRQAGVKFPAAAKPIPIVGIVDQEGVVGTAREDQWADRPALGDIEAAALRIQAPGDPMDGWVVYFVPGTRVNPDAVGRFSVVRKVGKREALFLGVLNRGYEQGKWNITGLKGRLTAEGMSVAWAAPVLWVRTT